MLALLGGRSSDAQAQGASALAELARDSSMNQLAIAQAGGISPLLSLLSSRSPDVHAQAALAVSTLAHGNGIIQVQVARAGGIGLLLALLSKSTLAQVNLMHIVCALLACHEGEIHHLAPLPPT